MKLSISVNSWDFLPQKVNLIEKLLMGIPKKRKNIIVNLSNMVEKKQIDGIELIISVKNSQQDIKKLYELFNQYYIPILSVHQAVLQILKIDIPSIEFLFETAKTLNAKVIVVHLYAIRKLLEKPEKIEYLRKLERDYQIQIGLENSSRDIGVGLFSGIAKKFAWDGQEFTKTITNLGMKVTFDTTHFGLSEWGINRFFLENKDRIINIHLSDYKDNLLGSHLLLGKGVLPMKDFLRTIKLNKYKGLVTLEINADFPELIGNINYVKDVL